MVFLIKHSHSHGVDVHPVAIPQMASLLEIEGLEARVCRLAGVDYEPGKGEDVEFLEIEVRDMVNLDLDEVLAGSDAADSSEPVESTRFHGSAFHGAVISRDQADKVFRALENSGHIDLAEIVFAAAGGRYTSEQKELASRALSLAESGSVEEIDDDGTTEIDDNPAVSLGTDSDSPGAYIQTWTWVPLD